MNSRAKIGLLSGVQLRKASCLSFAVAAILGTWVTSSQPAQAVITTFTDRTSWQTAASLLGTIQNEDFETLSTGALVVGSNQLGLINFDIQLLTATTAGASINGSPALGGIRDLSMNADDGMRAYTMSFGGPIQAMGFDFAGAATGGVAVLIADGERFDFGAASSGFFGITSTTSLADVQFGDTSPGAFPTEIFDSDNYSFVVIPEPTGLLLLAFLAAPALAHRRRSR